METWETHEFAKGMLDPKPDPYLYDRRLFREERIPPPVIPLKAEPRLKKSKNLVGARK